MKVWIATHSRIGSFTNIEAVCRTRKGAISAALRVTPPEESGWKKADDQQTWVCGRNDTCGLEFMQVRDWILAD